MIVARGLTKRFGKITAVHSLDFEVPQGAVVALLGPNGAGKSTTIRMLTGFLMPSGGSVAIDGLDVTRHRRTVQQRIGYLPESTPLYGELRVREYLNYRATLFSVPRRQRRGAIDDAMKRCWIDDVRRRPIHQLSKGYRQRVGLAAALLHNPKVLVLDEPTAGLDPTQIRESRQLIRDLAGERTIILSTHILSEAEQTCDRAIMLMAGRIRAQGTIDSLRATLASSHHAPYIVEARGSVIESAVRTVAGVAEVEVFELPERWVRLTVTPTANAGDLRQSIAKSLAEARCDVRELHRDSATLEQMFVQLAGAAEQESKAVAPA
jgi:ABC-2 type transport system ATP-binding protein